ncbi:PRC-barrel domain-containing protein [Streptomyces poonensis]|uniref:PRC domain containing protein n=1 Tax=Streptomyces poonensis TaxID=68255 RepID=A0A918UFC9_9ACTN|nr:PRC-barrel domain-containing protein [Streptomyces poonensis]GGZ00300.1 hypothetical protein GCM10010365_18850 [Streptomyces poonensis]GLJ92127.1 hypothetical protein GCM10017589_47360 [Streptomyces poonensis]
MDFDDIWSYAERSGHQEGQILTGYSVEAADGTLGHVDRQADDTGRRHLIVDTGVWVFGKSVLVPAGLVERIDAEAQRITVAPTREEVKSAPLFRTDRETSDAGYLDTVAAYYRGLPRRQST